MAHPSNKTLIASGMPESSFAPESSAHVAREFRRIIDQLIDTFYRTDLDGRIVLVSQAARELLGWTPEDLIGQRLADFYVDEQGREKFLNTLQSSGGKVIGYEAVLRRKDGSEVWVETNAHFVRDDAGQVCGVEGTVRDITKRRGTERALRDSEERFRCLQDLSSTGIAIHEYGILIDANVALARLTGYGVDELIGMNCLDLATPECRALVRERIRSGDDKPYFVMGLRKDGSTFPVEVCGRNMPYHGRMIRVAEFQDITARRAAEKEREQLQLQIQQAQKMEAIGQLTGGIAHDFNNIMTAILGYAKLARAFHSSSGDTKLGEFLEQIIRSGERAANLVSQMMAFSRASGFSELQAVAAATLLDEVLKMLRPTLPSTLEITRAVDDVVAPVHVDPGQLHQVLTNLIINARDAAGERGTLELAVRQQQFVGTHCSSCHGDINGDWVGLTIADNGPGMDPATASQIFRPFFTTKDVGKGTGMGLSVAHGIVHRLGGHILVDSAPKRGATFTVLLPPFDAGIADGERASSSADGSGSLPKLSGTRVLVIDDEEVLCRFYREVLQVHGCIVTTYSDSRAALAAFEREPDAFDLVLTDQTMPGLTGQDLLPRVLQLRPHLPVIICTGYSAQLNAAKAEQLGAAAFLAKPVPIDVLLNTIVSVREAARIG